MRYSTLTRLLPIVLLSTIGLSLPAPTAGSPLQAQEVRSLERQLERRLGRPVTEQDVLRWLRESELAPEEIRRMLQVRGYDPQVADAFLRVLEGETDSVRVETDHGPLLELLVDEGVIQTAVGPVPPPSREVPAPEPAAREEEPEGPPIFGRSLFRRATSQFVPPTAGPVPADYRLGPGDELLLVLTGDVEEAYRLEVTPEGWVVIPDVGRVVVNGLTMAGLESALRERLGDVYSGLRPGPEATTRFDVSVSEVRANQVYVVGEVEEPGAYRVGGTGTALTALYWAGGPGQAGSFRRVLVNRGATTVAELDLYEYLLRGRAASDLRLQQGDVVFVPTAGPRVRLEGAVRRPGVYELRPGETLEDLLRFAGGAGAEADLGRVQVQRILAPEDRGPGRDRAVLDFSLAGAADGRDVPLRDGDRVTVFAVLESARNQVVIGGGVWRPGSYAAEPGLRLWDLIRRAGGLLPDAYEARAQIQRLEEDDHTRRMIPVSLERDADGTPVVNPEIRGMDQVFVYAKRNLREDRVVSVGGWVQRPGVYPYVEGMSLRDLVLKAGGVRTGAYLEQAEVSRVLIEQAHTDTLTRRFEVPLDSSYVVGGPPSAGGDGDAGGAGPGGDDGPDEDAGAVGGAPGARAAEFALHNLDAVYIRKSPGFEPQQAVIVAGEVMLPGPYSLQTRRERIVDLLRRAGGLTPDAYPQGLQLWRAEPAPASDTLTAAEIAGREFGELSEEEERRLEAAGELRGEPAGSRERLRPAREDVRRTRVGVDFVRALEEPDGRDNVLVEPNDSIFVPRYIPTVEVRGAVGLETKVLYREGADLDYYIDQAGGYADDADRDRTRVRYANGEVRTRDGGFLFFGGGVPDPDPGSQITVPVEPPRESGGLRMTELVGILTSVATAAATVIIATR